MDERIQENLMHYALVFFWMLSGDVQIIAYFGERDQCKLAQQVYARKLSPLEDLSVFCIEKEMK